MHYKLLIKLQSKILKKCNKNIIEFKKSKSDLITAFHLKNIYLNLKTIIQQPISKILKYLMQKKAINLIMKNQQSI